MPQKKDNLIQTKFSMERQGNSSQNTYFLSLELQNVRCFGEKQKIDFSDGNNRPRQWTIILGDNGVGKTTLLQSLVALLPSILHDPNRADREFEYMWVPQFEQDFALQFHWNLERDDFIEYKLLSKFFVGDVLLSDQKGEIINDFQFRGSKRNRKSFRRGAEINDLSAISCFAYGASRKVTKTSLLEQSELSAYKTLFDESSFLINPEEWLLQADYYVSRSSAKKSREKFGQVKEILISVLPDVDDIRITEKNNKEKSFPIPVVEFHTPYGWVESKDLSIGYRTYMAWIVDFASRMFDRYPESKNPLAEPAVVLIDEIDLHLHPKWQRELIDYLTNLFPNTQFIVTTHSPLIVQAAAARDANIVVCRREGDHVVIDQSIEAVRGWRADQILTSDLFDLPSTRDTELERLEKQRREILSKPKLTKTDEKKLKQVSAELDSLRVMENPENDKAMDIIRRAAAQIQNAQN